jgi:hypothetical protein
VSSVKYELGFYITEDELGFYITEDGILHGHLTVSYFLSDSLLVEVPRQQEVLISE